MDTYSDPSETPDTIKIYGSVATMDTDLQKARNALALAMRDYDLDQTNIEKKTAMLAAQKEVQRLEQEYEAARQLLLQHVCAKQNKGKSS